MGSFVALSRMAVLGAVGLWALAPHADPVERPSSITPITPHQPAALEAGAQAAAAEGAEGLVSTLQAALDEMTHLREELAAVRRRNVELEAAQAADRMALALLREELERTHTEADALRDEVKLSWRWIDELNMVLDRVRAGAPRRTRRSGRPARAAGARPRPLRRARRRGIRPWLRRSTTTTSRPRR